MPALAYEIPSQRAADAVGDAAPGRCDRCPLHERSAPRGGGADLWVQGPGEPCPRKAGAGTHLRE